MDFMSIREESKPLGGAAALPGVLSQRLVVDKTQRGEPRRLNEAKTYGGLADVKSPGRIYADEERPSDESATP